MNRQTTLVVNERDDLVVALVDLAAGVIIADGGQRIVLRSDVAAKHKFARRDIPRGDDVRMYGITVGKAVHPIAAGDRITTSNLVHATDAAVLRGKRADWQSLDVNDWREESFQGYVRSDGRVGTANYWIVVPLVFCENRNLDVLREALLDELGYGRQTAYRNFTRELLRRHQDGASPTELLTETLEEPARSPQRRVFPHVDGIKFLRHEQGCGGTYEDAVNLCGLLAGYIDHPNVAGATVLSLGCQKSQLETLQQQLQMRNPKFHKPLYIFEQQQMVSEPALVTEALRHTLAGVIGANQSRRESAPLAELVVGVECGGSDGFSGLSANPAIGHCSDLIVSLGGSVILSEFPELAGCEQNLLDRCVTAEVAQRFLQIMTDYSDRAVAVGSGFDRNPSPGNIRDGLITDAMKSAGAALKGGSSLVTDVLDYPEQIRRKGLTLLCTPGGDVESTTAMAGAGATVQLFSTGLGTPTGNAVSPVIKISTNSDLASRLPDMIDLDAGTVITGSETIEQVGRRILHMVIATASGDYETRAQLLGQDDFIPWKRGISF
jgi:altronate hydrolase